MANRSVRRAASRRKAGGRVTPKGTGSTRPESTSGRYTPPIPREMKVSPIWVPILMFALLGIGTLVIILNYLGLLPTESGEASNWYLILGLGFITGGFITATRYH